MDAKSELAAIKDRSRALIKAVNAPMKGFGQLSAAVKEPGALSTKEKEYIAVGIAIAQGCDDCVNFHVEVLQKLGCTREEFCEVLGMCLQMGGGPVVMNAGRALEVWDQLQA
ncbi:carboxymuconolactone decarboxylase family protein [Rhodobacter sp. NTK016B]|uniref:carboxymuconolactone decarboxylase family protein n=1 Tax=Rhodobacter sp. NTK016B TaxID=2759676 RepID=UPI001A8D70C9|nr:carboxymuconolactone decarboxylase family protein [Rhodobacter sp. NTK016B]MBN8291499.1 carboxymuconolactone decarboxylase family protein [Rhodobacter sp. NTK016B]